MRRLAILAALILLAVGCLPVSVDPSPAEESTTTTAPFVLQGTGGGFFYTRCDLTHSANADPIVFPGQPGASHLHDFFGGVGVDAFTQPEDLVGGSTSCLDQGDTAAYWTPSLELDGQTIRPWSVNARYSSGGKGPVFPFPQGLKVVAGGSYPRARWGCKGAGAPSVTKGAFTYCGATETVARVDFPDCWDGVNLDSPDHRSHLTYAVKNACPATHPVPLPSLSIKVHYGKNLPQGVATLGAMGMAPSTLHGDFLSAWVPERLAALVDYCINRDHNCGESSTGEPED